MKTSSRICVEAGINAETEDNKISHADLCERNLSLRHRNLLHILCNLECPPVSWPCHPSRLWALMLDCRPRVQGTNATDEANVSSFVASWTRRCEPVACRGQPTRVASYRCRWRNAILGCHVVSLRQDCSAVVGCRRRLNFPSQESLACWIASKGRISITNFLQVQNFLLRLWSVWNQ